MSSREGQHEKALDKDRQKRDAWPNGEYKSAKDMQVHILKNKPNALLPNTTHWDQRPKGCYFAMPAQG